MPEVVNNESNNEGNEREQATRITPTLVGDKRFTTRGDATIFMTGPGH
jgi:hypothetical protein